MPEIIEKTMYKCPDCDEAYDEYNRATRCAYQHAKERAINADFETGSYSLGTIWYVYGIQKELPDEMKNITKYNCFVVSYLQCCDFPAYQISHISAEGKITVCGDGSYDGGYSSEVGFHNLKDPRPADELWKYSDSGPFGRNKKKATTEA